MTQFSTSKLYSRLRRSSLPLALAALAGLVSTTGPLRAEKPTSITTPLCDGEAKCSLIKMKAESVWSSADDHSYVDRLQLYFNGSCRYELAEGGVAEVDDFTVYEVEPGHTQFIREWRVPAGCEYLIHARVQYDFDPDDIIRIELGKSDTAQDLCFNYDFFGPKRTDVDCN